MRCFIGKCKYNEVRAVHNNTWQKRIQFTCFSKLFSRGKVAAKVIFKHYYILLDPNKTIGFMWVLSHVHTNSRDKVSNEALSTRLRSYMFIKELFPPQHRT